MSKLLFDKFQVPEVAQKYIDHFMTEQEQEFVEKIDIEQFSISNIALLINEAAEEFAASAYHRGIISIADQELGLYKLNDFYGRLDILVVSEHEKYMSIPEEDRVKIENWYFETYYAGLDQDPVKRPTTDKVMLTDEVLDFIDRQDRPVYLNYCDCRRLAGGCGLPDRTCITYKNGPNTFVHRGLSEEIDKETAKAVVREANKVGLMHTVNDNGICNCCGDCCYLFRGQEKRGSYGYWPEVEYIVFLNKGKCIACGRCIQRCHLGAFEKKDEEIIVKEERCAGCGVCVTTCPVNALEMKGR